MNAASPSLATLARSYQAHSEARATVASGLAHLHTRGREVRQAAQVTGLPIRGAHERVCVHAERRRCQRPHPWLLPRHRLHPRSNQGPTGCLTGDQHLPNELRRLAVNARAPDRAGPAVTLTLLAGRALRARDAKASSRSSRRRGCARRTARHRRALRRCHRSGGARASACARRPGEQVVGDAETLAGSPVAVELHRTLTVEVLCGLVAV